MLREQSNLQNTEVGIDSLILRPAISLNPIRPIYLELRNDLMGIPLFLNLVNTYLDILVKESEISLLEKEDFQRMYGIGVERKTMYQIADKNRSRYRELRLFNKALCSELKSLILFGKSSNLKFEINDEHANSVLSYVEQKFQFQIIRHLTFINKVETDLKDPENPSLQNALFLLLAVFDFRLVKSPLHSMKYSEWIIHKKFNRKTFYAVYDQIIKVLKTTYYPVSTAELLQLLNMEIDNDIDLPTVEFVCSHMDVLDKDCSTNKICLQIDEIKSREIKVARILYANDKPMSKSEIVEKLNVLSSRPNREPSQFFNGLKFEKLVRIIGKKGLLHTLVK